MIGKRPKTKEITNVDDLSSASWTTLNEEKFYSTKNLHHSPSLKAMRTYNEMPINTSYDIGDTSTIGSNTSINFRKYDENSITRDSLENDNKSITTSTGYATVGTYSHLDVNSYDHNEMGSTLKLISPKVQQSWQTWLPYITSTLCSICMAAGLGNLYRLPQTTILKGGLPFSVVYIVLTIFMGLPLLYLEIGIGQLVQEGLTKSWRAVPFFKGVGYVKLLICVLLSIYYPLYIGLSLFYVIWILKGSLPFQECSSGVKITDSGYITYDKDGQTCLKTTFLKSPFEDLYWYGLFTGLLFTVWVVITIMSMWKTRSYIRSLSILLLPILAGYCFLLSKSIMLQKDNYSWKTFFYEADWSLLQGATIWYYASVQVFFSTSIGFGSFVTNAGVIYNKVNPFWTSVVYIFLNVMFGIGSVAMTELMLNHKTNSSSRTAELVNEISLIASVYDMAVSNRNDEMKVWTMCFYCVTLLSGFVSMASFIYTLLKAVSVQSKNRWKWSHTAIASGLIGYLLGCLALLISDFGIIHLLDHYIVGNLTMVVTVIDILALISFYGVDRIKADFEFMVGHILSRIWLILWWIIPLFLTAIFAWAMITLPLEGLYKEDASWLYGVGWAVVLCSTFLIFFIGYCVVSRQDGYTFKEKFKASVKPSKNWGPKDPISRLNWIQWNSKALQGEKDFTLKRKGTKDYTKSIKKNKPIQSQAPSEMSTASIQGLYKQKNKDHLTEANIYAEVSDSANSNQRNNNSPYSDYKISSSLRGNSDMDSLEMKNYKQNKDILPQFSENLYLPKPLNRVAQTNKYVAEYEDIDTLVKGPYIISDKDIDHICFRKYLENNNVSEL